MDVDKLVKEALERVYANIDANAAAAHKEINAKYHEIKKNLKIK